MGAKILDINSKFMYSGTFLWRRPRYKDDILYPSNSKNIWNNEPPAGKSFKDLVKQDSAIVKPHSI